MKVINKMIAIILLSGTGIGSVQAQDTHSADMDFTAMHRLCHRA